MSLDIPRNSRALYSPPDDSSPPIIPRWSQQRSRSMSASSRRSGRKTRLGALKSRGRKLFRWARKRVDSMTIAQRVFAVLALLILATTAILMLVFHSQLLHAMIPVAKKLRNWRAGWMFLFLFVFITAFPPMIGYSTAVTLSGFVYGFPNGWFIVAGGTIVGATCSFIACRYCFRNFAKRMVATDKRFAALSLVLKHDGVSMLCAIRACPLPYSLSNGAMSTFPTVTPWAFMFATAVVSPKLAIHIFIGQRMAILAEAGEKMDTKTKALNYGSIVFGAVLGIVIGWVIYKRTQSRVKQLEAEERSRLRGRPASSRANSLEGRYTDDDREAAAAAGILANLVEGEDPEDAGLFADSLETEDEGTLLGDETEDEEDRMIGLVDRDSFERRDIVKPGAPPGGAGTDDE